MAPTGKFEEKKNELKEDIEETSEKITEGLKSGTKKAGRFIKRLIIGLFILAILGGLGYLFFATMTYSDGSRAGELIKISEKGMVFKTYEGQLSLGGLSVGGEDNNETNIGNLWDFSVTDDAVYKKMEALRGKKVVVKYKEQYRAIPWKGDTKYIITDVEAN